MRRCECSFSETKPHCPICSAQVTFDEEQVCPKCRNATIPVAVCVDCNLIKIHPKHK